MAKAAPARMAACAALGDIRRRNAHARDVLRSSSRLEALSRRDRALAVRLVLGVVGAVGMLDEYIDRHVSRKIRLEPQVRDALRLGVYELLFLSTPQSVAVSQAVELIRTVRPRAAGLGNAVLRRVAQEDVPRYAALIEALHNGPVEAKALAAVGGLPEWLVRRTTEDRGAAAARDVCLAMREPAPVYVANNLFVLADEDAEAVLAGAGLAPEHAGLAGAFKLGAPGMLAESGLVTSTQVLPADLSAQRVVALCAPEPGECVLEVGQGRGTKSLLLENAALRAGGYAYITGLDAAAFKVRVAAERMERSGAGAMVSCREFDACRLRENGLPSDLARQFDLVFVDAPCSGTGTLRRHPEIAWSLQAADVTKLAALQLRMLQAAAARVRPGGRLCYATCSVLAEENESVVASFLASEEGSCFKVAADAFQSLPASDAPDGHFCQCMVLE